MARPELPNWVPAREGPERITNYAIEKLRKPLEKLLEQLRARIEAGDYGLILGDDASGRVPTRVLDKVIKYRYEELGHELPMTLFIAGSRSIESHEQTRKQKAIEDLLEQNNMTSESARRVLLVTDTIASGESLLPVARALQKKSMPFDIASVGLAASGNNDEQVDYLTRKLGNEALLYGEVGTPEIYNKSDLSGVFKIETDLHAQRAKPRIAKYLGRGREEMDLLAAELTQKYKGTSK